MAISSSQLSGDSALDAGRPNGYLGLYTAPLRQMPLPLAGDWDRSALSRFLTITSLFSPSPVLESFFMEVNRRG